MRLFPIRNSSRTFLITARLSKFSSAKHSVPKRAILSSFSTILLRCDNKILISVLAASYSLPLSDCRHVNTISPQSNGVRLSAG